LLYFEEKPRSFRSRLFYLTYIRRLSIYQRF
jgi:hypothetical protein